VVIAIIALLMSILAPALAKAKKGAQDAICRSQLHQWSLIWKIVVEEYEEGNEKKREFFPSRDLCNEWMDMMRKAHFEDENNPKTLFKMLLCPSATKTAAEGGENPYMAWDDTMSGIDFKFSYGINLWISNESYAHKGTTDGFWRTPNQKYVSYAPIIMDAQWGNADPIASDDPSPYEWSNWTHNAEEMQRSCIKRHGRYHINGLFGDFSVKTHTIKELWMIKWHREWPPGFDHLPVWQPWMDDVPNPQDTWIQ
jgi:hypothetical protein